MTNTIRMYTLSTCGHCKSAKKFMLEHNIRYEFTDVDLLTGDDRKAVLDDLRQINPSCTFPTILIGDLVIIGFNEQKLLEALNA